jgi:VanZ family protein
MLYLSLQNFSLMLQLIINLRPPARYFLILGILLISTISSLPSLPTPKIDTGKIEIRLDYVFHLLEYGALAFFAFLTFTGKDFYLSSRYYLVITFCLLLFCVLDEFHQKLIPGRSFNPKDIMSNISGVLAGLVFCIIFFRKIFLKKY